MRVVLFGECMIELQGEAFGVMRQSFGGDTLNTAVYLARCGAEKGIKAFYATGLGDDSFSVGMLARWRAEGIGVDYVRQMPGRTPGLYAISVNDAGERQFTYWRDNSAARSYFDAPATPLEQAAAQIDALYLSGVSLAILTPESRARLFAVMRRVRQQGGRVAFDNNYRPSLWPDAPTARAAFQQALALSDIALLTLDDERALRPDASVEQCLRSADCEMVIRRGADSTLVRERGAGPVIEAPTQPVPRVVDTTAAGDSFSGAYLAARLSGSTAAAAAAAGNALAAIVIQHRGAILDREVFFHRVQIPA